MKAQDLRDSVTKQSEPATNAAKKQALLAGKYAPGRHKYVTHHTYTGPGCAMCGRPESEHVAATGLAVRREDRRRMLQERHEERLASKEGLDEQ